MNRAPWFLWLTILIGTCYCSYDNYNTPKYCGVSKPLQQYESKNESTTPHTNYISLVSLSGTSGTLPNTGNAESSTQQRKKGFDPAKHLYPDIQALVHGTDRFKVKHMYMDGSFGDRVNSFDKLTGNPEKIRRYIVELHRKMFKGQILPQTISSTQTFDKWMEAAQEKPKKVSLIDTYLQSLEKDITSQPAFQQYLAEVKARKRGPRQNNLFTTKRKFMITEITLKADMNQNLNVEIERFYARIEIGMINEKVFHYDKSDHSVFDDGSFAEMSFVDVEQTSQKAILQTKFTRKELKRIEKVTLGFWKELFQVDNVNKVRYYGPLNEKVERFQNIVQKYEEQWNKVIMPPDGSSKQTEIVKNTPGACPKGGAGRIKRAGNRCAFYIDSDGEVESIHPEEFMEVYELAQEEGRGKMVGLLKKNGDKYIVDDDKNWEAASRRLNQLIHHDEMTIHAELVETTGTIQDWRRWKIPVPKKPSQIVHAISEAVSARMNNVKLSATKVVHSLAKNPHLNALAKAERPFGDLMMAKGIINGIVHNDTTAIAVIGSRLGYDVVTEVGAAVGTKFFSAATKVGKGARILGKVAGPIGIVADIGLGAWSLAKSVERLKESDNKYDRDDAIADVVSESIDIAVGAATLIVSAVFPPAAPLIFAAALVINVLNQMATALFKAGNEVKRLNHEIALSGAEKVNVFASRFFDIFGVREKDYIDYLVEEKHANDLAVDSYLKFLRSTDQFMGVVFPSRSLSIDGGCELQVYAGKWMGIVVWKLEATYKGCSWNTPCAKDGKACVNEKTFWYEYKCICDDNKKSTDFGVPHTDSDVDFRQKRKVYWERAVPGDVSGAEFKCKPSYLKYTDSRTQQLDSRIEYHCFHAIGLYLPEKERKKGQSFLVNLEDGKDSVVTDQKLDDTPYTFWLGEKGEKSFTGGNNRNEFILNGKCSEGLLSGYLYGGPKNTDSFIVGPSCAKGEVVEFMESHGNMLKVKLNNKLDLNMERVENIIGRPKDAEHVRVGCKPVKLFLNGGASSRNPDSINVIPTSCNVNLVSVLGNYTNFHISTRSGEITIYIGQDMEGSSINFGHTISGPDEHPNTTIIFTESTAQIIDVKLARISSRDITVKIWDSSSHARDPLTIKYDIEFSPGESEQHKLFFNESTTNSPNTFSILSITYSYGPLRFFHNLQENQASMDDHVTRVGNPSIPNVFNISGKHWNLRGGQMDDMFLLNTDIHSVAIDGKDGKNTLVVQRYQSSMIDLNGNDKLKSVDTVVKGNKIGSSLEVSTGCDTKAVVTNGDDSKFPDIVRIHSCNGVPRELQIDAGGWSSVVVDGDLIGENEIVRVVAHRTSSTPVKFRLETGNVQASKLFLQVELGPEPETLRLRELSRDPDGKSFRAVMGMGGVDSLDLNLGINEDDGFYLSTPQIQLFPKTGGHPSQLVFRRDTLDPVAVHVIQKDERELAHILGFKQLQNLFQIQSGYWTIEGGFVKDTFVGDPGKLAFTNIQPNKNSDNTLVVDDSYGIELPFHVNLQLGKMGFEADMFRESGKITGGYIQHVIGRQDQEDVITTGCVGKSVAGRGGRDQDHPDLIVINDNDNCGNEEDKEMEMELHLGKFTKVENSAESGSFKYFVDLKEQLAKNPFTIAPNARNQHKIVFQDGGQQSRLTIITFDQHQQKMGFHVGKDSIIEFPMYRHDDEGEYTNPKFLVTSKDNWVTRDVRVDNVGSVVATALIESDCDNKLDRRAKGLPVDINNFLINIKTQGDNAKCETVLEAGEKSRSNHFWLYGLSFSNQLTIRGFERSEQISSIHLDQDFVGNQSIIANLSSHQGYMSIPGTPEVKLMFIDKFVGRSNPVSYDTVIPSCYTKQISSVDLVDIKIDPSKDCAFNLIIGMEPGTQVNFEWNGSLGSGRNLLSEFWSSTFHYRFTEPMSFELGQSYPGLLDGTEHNLYLPFNLDEMETLSFEEDEIKLYYTIGSEKYTVTMVSEPGDEDQFYPQPNMVTQDGLRILVGRDSSLLISGQLRGSNAKGQELLEKYQGVANNLGVTMVIQTDAGLLHIGHDGSDSDRNVVQNVAYSDSYLGGGGQQRTIYEVVSLNKNVYIATGIIDEIFEKSSLNTEGPYSAMQTLDLTDIVSPIRYQTMKKYKPAVSQVGNDLVITMEDHLDKYPGQIVIYGGVSEIVRENLQVLLSNAMMRIIPPADDATGNNWQLVPIPVRLERETVYSLAAEDLEYDHHITILDHLYGPEYHFRFNYSKHGDDLHLSDIEEFRDHRYDKKHIEMTTVIITDFYKKLNAEQVVSTGAAVNISNSIHEDAPAEIVNVTLDLPGLKIRLNGTDVFLLSNENELVSANPAFLSPTIVQRPVNGSTNFLTSAAIQTITSPSTAKYQSPVLLSPNAMTDWSNVLHRVEQDILEELPFVDRIY